MPNYKIEFYYKELRRLSRAIVAKNKAGKDIGIEKGFFQCIKLILDLSRKGNKLIFIGNGGSATIASHMATDFCKNGNIKALAINDYSLLTSLSNDLGYQYVFSKPIELLGESGDILFAISSSGKSENILWAAKTAKAKNIALITLSGFDKDNPLSKTGEINFYVPSHSYSHVEILHHSICHYLLDMILDTKNGVKKKG